MPVLDHQQSDGTIEGPGRCGRGVSISAGPLRAWRDGQQEGSPEAGPARLPLRLTIGYFQVLPVAGAGLSLFSAPTMRIPVGASVHRDDRGTGAVHHRPWGRVSPRTTPVVGSWPKALVYFHFGNKAHLAEGCVDVAAVGDDGPSPYWTGPDCGRLRAESDPIRILAHGCGSSEASSNGPLRGRLIRRRL